MWNFLMGLGVSLVVFGIIHRRYKLVGYNPKKVVDKEGLANWTGANLIVMGVIAILIGILAYIMPATNDIFFYIIGLIIFIIIFIRAVMGCKKYEVK